MSKSKANPICVAVVLMAVVVLISCAVPALHRSMDTPGSAEATVAPAKLSVVMKAHIGALKYLTFAPGGRYVAGIADNGKIIAYTSRGVKCYSTQVAGANRVALAPDGSFGIVFSRLDPSNTTCVFIDSQGHTRWKKKLRGSIWCADSCCTDGGTRFVIGTGKKRVYVIDIGERRRRCRWWRTPGAVVSVDVDAEGKDVILGTWQNSTVQRRSIRGRRIWSMDVDDSAMPMVERLVSSDRVCVRYISKSRSANASFDLIDTNGRIASSGTIDSRKKSRVLFSPSAKYICTGSVQTILHKGKSMTQKRTTLQECSGKRIWEKGSVFFQAEPIMVSARGDVLMQDGNNTLFIASASGSLEQTIKLSAKMLRNAMSQDGSLCGVNCSDGNLYVLKMSP
ncbi:MAG: WD40 repeat domain-containing protein [Armatimonadota bacterium]|nr:WD40 repeat domain-containing protein [bacterium]